MKQNVNGIFNFIENHTDMDILKTAIEWAKSEVFSSMFFILFGGIFLIMTLGFWQLGKTEVAKAYIIPTMVAGILLLIVGFGIFFTNRARTKTFETEYNANASDFIQSELKRTKQSMGEYKTIVFKVIPFIIVAAAITIAFISNATWRAIALTTIAMMTVIIFVDSNANARLKAYHSELELAVKQ